MSAKGLVHAAQLLSDQVSLGRPSSNFSNLQAIVVPVPVPVGEPGSLNGLDLVNLVGFLFPRFPPTKGRPLAHQLMTIAVCFQLGQYEGV